MWMIGWNIRVSGAGRMWQESVCRGAKEINARVRRMERLAYRLLGYSHSNPKQARLGEIFFRRARSRKEAYPADTLTGVRRRHAEKDPLS